MNEQAVTSRSLLWQRLDSPSLEMFELEQNPIPILSGTVVLELADQPAAVHYRISTADWQTRQVTVTLRHGIFRRRLELRVDDEQRWWQGEEELTGLRGLYDVDLSVTPATNTLPLRRLGLNVGESRDVTAAWVKFPELGLEPLPQRYTRLGEDRYRYESGDAFADFSAELMVDDAGLITQYLMTGRPDEARLGWTRLASAG